MKKSFVLFLSAFLTLSVFSQNVKTHPGIFTRISKQKELTAPGIPQSFLNFHLQINPSKTLPHLKNANTLKQKLDSVVAPGYDKDEYFYDASGNLLQNIYYEWEENNWRNTAKYDYSYDADVNLVKSITVYWDNSEWVNYMKEEYTFDASGNQTQNESYIWTGSEWENYYEKDEYAFDASGNQTQHISYSWMDGQYLKTGKEESEFDENNNQTQNIMFFWDGDQWLNVTKIEFTYDESGNQTQNIGYNWVNNLWVNFAREEFVFDTTGKNTLFIGSGWDGENWFYIEKHETVYDDNESITHLVYSEWDGTEWLEAAKYEYQYDAGGNMILSQLVFFFEDQQIIFYREESIFDEYGNRISWSFFAIDFESEEFLLSPMLKQEYTYDNTFTFEDLILPYTADDFEGVGEIDIDDDPGVNLNQLFNHKLTNFADYEGDGDSWLKLGDYTFYYSEQTITGINDLNLANNVSVFPNPASNRVTFNIKTAAGLLTVKIFDLHGKLVLNKMVTNNNPVSIESLNEGLYLYRLSEGQYFYTGKIMVR